ncbi:MAG: NAD(P)/FAD-dependent oxidoreductase [Acidimicrobiales bacterium]
MTTVDHDRDAVRERYRLERDKRLRADGNEQYVEMAGQYAHYLDDPYVAPVDREPLTDEVTVALIGGGFAGLITGARLVQAGITDLRVIEKGGDVGGTWYWNRYPGAQCDVESYVYLPLLEETGYVPTEKYAHAPEIQGHCRRIASHFGLYDNACFSTQVTSVVWDDDASRWIIHTNRGDAMRARFVVMGNGPLHRPKLPGIPGIESFAGKTFHTSRWDYDYTGVTRAAVSTSWPTSGWGSSAPAPPPSSACPTWPGPARSSTSSSAHRRPSTPAGAGPPIPTGPVPSSPAGRSSGSPASPR